MEQLSSNTVELGPRGAWGAGIPVGVDLVVHVELGPSGTRGVGILVGCSSSSPTWSWGLAGPEGQGSQWSEHRLHGWGLSGLAVLLVDCGVEKPSMIYGFKVPYFWLSLCFTSAKHISSVLAGSLIHGTHAVCGCVPITILDLLQHLPFIFFHNTNFKGMKCCLTVVLYFVS
jgi:hypothetical protein